MSEFLNSDEWWKANEKIGWGEIDIGSDEELAVNLRYFADAPTIPGGDFVNIVVINHGATNFIQKMTELVKSHGFPYRVRPDGSFQFISGSGFVAKDGTVS